MAPSSETAISTNSIPDLPVGEKADLKKSYPDEINPGLLYSSSSTSAPTSSSPLPLEAPPAYTPNASSPARFSLPTRENTLRTAVPQLSPTKGAPFLRAYSQQLLAHSITEQSFITFIDGLNHVALSNSFLTTLDVAGGILWRAPLPILPLLGHDLSKASKLGNAALSKAPLAKYLLEANEKVFAPAGLRVSVCPGSVMRQQVGVPPAEGILAPLSPGVQSARQMTFWQRWMVGLEGRVAEVRESALPLQGVGLLDRLACGNAAKVVEREEKRLMRSRGQMLKGKGRGRDEEEVAAERMLWVLVEVV